MLMRMTDFFSQNLHALTARDPQLATRIKIARDNIAAPVEISPSWFDCECDGAWFYARNPQAAVETSLAQITTAHPRVLLCVGVGLGQHILHAYAKLDANTVGIYVVEQSLELFAAALGVGDWTALLHDPRVELLIGLASAQIPLAMHKSTPMLERLMAQDVKTVMTHQPSIARDPEYYAEVPRKIAEAETAMMGIAIAPPEDAYVGFLSVIQNLAACAGAPELFALHGAFAGKVGIAVSTGPSLQHSFAWLREAQHHTVIACADSALRILLREGITPHFVGCLERVPETELLFRNLPALPNTHLLAAPVIWPDTFRNYPGPKILMMRRLVPLPLLFPESTYYPTGPSVSHMIYTALHAMGCARILLVGQDLAYDRHSTRTHADGMPPLLAQAGQAYRNVSLAQMQHADSGALVEGNDGAPILTTYWYNVFREALNGLIWQSKVETFNVIPRDYGAHIAMATWYDPAEARTLLQPESASIPAIITQHLDRASVLPPAQFHTQMQERLAATLASVQLYVRLCGDVLDNLSQYQHRHNALYFQASLYEPFFERIQHIVRELCKDPVIQYLVAGVTQGELVKIGQRADRALFGNVPEQERINEQFTCLHAWFSALLQWGTRIGIFLERDVIPHYPHVIFPHADTRAAACGRDT